MTAPESLPPQRQPGTGPTLADDAAGHYVSYQLGASEYRQYRDVLCAVSKDQEPYPILPGRLAVDEVSELRDVGPDLRPQSTILDSSFQVTYTPPSGQTRSTRASAVDMDAREPEWHHQLGIAARTPKKKVDTVANAVRAMGQHVETRQGWPQAYASTGLVLQDGTPAFLRPDLPALTGTGNNPHLRCELPAGVGEHAGIQALSLDDPSSPDQFAGDLMALLRVLDTVPDQPSVPMALLCQLAWAPWSGLPDLGRIALVLAGATGNRKTALAGAVTLAAQSRTYEGGAGVEVPVQVKMRGNQSTTFGIDQLLHPMQGHVAIVDDYFAGRMTQREVDEAWKRLSTIADNAVTGGGGTKGGYRNGRGVINKGKYPRSCILATAEDLPDESERSSEIARYVALMLDADVDPDVLTEVQANPRALSRAHAGMIQHGLADLEAPRRALAWGSERAQQWECAGHSRVHQSYAKLLAGAYLIGQAMERAGLDSASFLSDADAQLCQAADDQARRSGMSAGRDMARDPVRLFVRHFTQMVAAEPYWLASSERRQNGDSTWSGEPSEHPEFQPPALDGHGPSAVGWRQVGQSGGWTPAGRGDPLGAVYVASDVGRKPWRPVILRMPSARWDQLCDDLARRVRSLDGWSMPAPDVIRRKLVQAGYLKAERGESLPVWSSDTRKRSCLSLDLGRILEGDDPEPPDDGGEHGAAAGGGGDDGSGSAPAGDPRPQPDHDGSAQPDTPAGAEDATQRALALLSAELGATVLVDDAEPHANNPDAGTATETGPAQTGTPDSSGEGCRQHGSTAASQRSSERSRGHGVVAVLDRDGVHVGADAPVTVPRLPASLAEAYELAEARGVGQLWLHPRLTAALPDRPVDIAHDAGVPHPWADLAGTGLDADPGGLAPWIVVWHDGQRRDTSRSVVLPAYETRVPFADAPDGAALYAAVTGLRDALGADYYRSPNATAVQYVRRHSRSVAPCPAIHEGRVPPAVRHRQMVPAKTARPLADGEDDATFVHRFDRNAAELAGMNTPLGVGEPEHRPGPIAFEDQVDKKLAGYWCLSGQPAGLDARLPRLNLEPNEDGRIWVTTPDVVLLRWLGVCPDITEAWVWPDSRQALQSTQRRLQAGRKALLAGRGTTAGEIAYKAHGALYKSFIGYLARTDGPRGDDDGLWRPDWRDMIRAQTYCNIYRQLAAIGAATGRYPVAAHADAAFYVSTEHEGQRAAPEGMRLDIGGGGWKHEGCVPLAAIRRECGERRFHVAFDTELERRKGRGDA